MTPAEVEAGLARAAAVAMLGDRVPVAEQAAAARTLAWLDLIEDLGRRRVSAMRCIPSRATGNPHRWTHIAQQLRITTQTARAWHAANLAVIAEHITASPTLKENTMPKDEAATVTVTINGQPVEEWEAQQRGAPRRPVVTSSGDDRVRRVVAPGRQLEWEGATHHAGDVVHLPPARANELLRARIVTHPQDFDQPRGRPVAVVQDGSEAGAAFQGPRYDVVR